jgi:drug/metabolite transporter (DMT)-like permease
LATHMCHTSAHTTGMAHAGTILVALADSFSPQQEGQAGGRHGVLGDALTLAAAALYACYTITLKRMMPDDNESDMMAFFGYLGVVNIAVFGPVVLGMQLFGAFDMFALGWSVCALALVKGALS